MGIQRASVLYPVNGTTVDSGTGIDIRLLDSAQAGATDSTQSVRFTHTQDGQERTFDPGTALVTTEADATSPQGEGWALRLTEDMTPTDDTNCNAMLTSGTLVVNVRALLNMNGGTNVGGNTIIVFRASLWQYSLNTDSFAEIASGSQSQTWDTSALGGENNTRKNTAISISVPANVEFNFNTQVVFLLQIGCEGNTLPNATIGTTNFDVTLDVDDADTNLTFAAGQGIRQWCRLSGDSVGKGTVTRGALAIEMSRTPIGKGTATVSKATIASKSFSLTGKGTVTETHPVIASKSFALTGRGTILVGGADGSTITLPIDHEFGEGGDASILGRGIRSGGRM